MRDGTRVEVRQANVGRETSVTRKIFPPSTNLLNATFDPGSEGWSITRGPVARVSIDTKRAFIGSTSLLATGTGRIGSPPSFVEQTVVGLPRKAPGTAYEVSIALRTRGLTRPLLPEMKMIYEDGSYEFFTTPSAGARIASFSPGWRRVKVRGAASKQLKAIVVYALDTGTGTPVRGSEWLDDARLVLARKR
jgi:hypothetical protein